MATVDFRAEPIGEAWPERPGAAGAESGKLAHGLTSRQRSAEDEQP